MSLRPYPVEWERHLVRRDGWRVFARPIRPDDKPLLRELLRHVTQEDLRLRFFESIKEFSHQFLDGLTQLDYAGDGICRDRRSQWRGSRRCPASRRGAP
jgi:acetyltransferase